VIVKSIFRKKRTRKAQSLEIEVFRFILDRISDKDWGIDTRTRKNRNRPVPHVNPAGRIKCALNGDPMSGGQRAFVPSITHKMLWEHQLGSKTLCFTGNGHGKAPESLFLLDVDCKDRRNPDQARRYLDDLMADPNVPDFAGLFVEPSTSGGGAHGYGVLVKGVGQDDESVNSCLKMLQEYLRRRLAEGHECGLYGDISDVEIKGTCMELEWKEGRVEHVRCGQLAKIPVTALDRPREFLNLARVPQEVMRRLHRLPIEFPREQSPPEVTARSGADQPKRRGSTRKHPISRAVIERIGSVYSVVAHKYVPLPLPTTDRHVVTAEDVAIWLAIVAYITLHQDEDKAMPSRRIAAIWNALYEERSIKRPHCFKRSAAIRNHLSDLGLIDWQDDRYWSPDKANRFAGEVKKGVCCKYSLGTQLMYELGLEDHREGVSGSRESTAGTSPETLSFTTSAPGTTNESVTNEPQTLRLLHLERPVIRPIRVGWASEYWGREAA
jgi:hypothetical protein